MSNPVWKFNLAGRCKVLNLPREKKKTEAEFALGKLAGSSATVETLLDGLIPTVPETCHFPLAVFFLLDKNNCEIVVSA